MSREEEIMQEANARYIVSHPFVDIAKDSFIEGAKWADETMIDKACEWLKGYLSYEGINEDWSEILITNFRKAMEE